jgi:penicillin-binding protein 1A
MSMNTITKFHELKRLIKQHRRGLFVTGSIGVFLAIIAALGLYLVIVPRLPSIDVLKDVRYQVPLKIYSRDMKLIAEYGEKRRTPLEYNQIPDLMIKAVLAAEDARFFEHPGVDFQGLLRAAFYLIRTGEKGQGGSTITMQVARNFFLSREKTYLRKINEIMLALKIEDALTKEEILSLYLNKIYLGNRAYGIAAAAQVYYGKPIDKLNIAQMAMIAGLPKAPSSYNPIVNPSRAVSRRNYVLGRMRALNFITEEDYQQAMTFVDDASLHGLSQEVTAPYVAEMVRAEMVKRYGDEAYSGGYSVITSLDSRLQASANHAHRDDLLAYDRRHGYRGPISHQELTDDGGEQQWMDLLRDQREVNGLYPALVLWVEDQLAVVYEPHRGVLRIDWPGLKWAAPALDDGHVGRRPKQASDILARGDIIRIVQEPDGQWSLAQVPTVEGALVSLDPHDGAIRALVGGFDFANSKFNRVTQAERQPGSNFKPFTYSAGLAKGFTPATLINDAPVVFEDKGLEATWRPENYSGKVFGPTRLREALVHSRNLVSIRLLRSIGISYDINYVSSRFGFDKKRLPRDLSLALGSGAVTPLEIVTGYAVFANGGYRTVPYYIDRIENAEGEVEYRAEPYTVCDWCKEKAKEEKERLANGEEPFVGPPTRDEMPPVNIATQVLTPQNAYLMRSMMMDVIKRGTGRRARVLNRPDIAGKTGTTNDQQDAWFSGFTPDVVTTTWVGFDKPKPLGVGETGARAALPMWIDFMRTALKGLPIRPLRQPPGLVTVRIDPKTGLLASADNPHAIFETFRVQNVPKRHASATAGVGTGASETPGNQDSSVSEEIF